LTTTHSHATSRVAPAAEELSAAQRAAVTSDARLVVVQGGPGTGKTETAVARAVRLISQQRQDPAWLLVLVANQLRARGFRARLARSLAAAGYPASSLDRASACVVPYDTLAAQLASTPDASPTGSVPEGTTWPPEALERAAAVAGELASSLGLGAHPDEGTPLVLDAMRYCLRNGGVAAASDSDFPGDGGWFRRGVGLVEEAVRSAQVEALRRLRMLEGTAGWIGDLGRQLRRPSDVAARARDLRSAIDRACRSETADGTELERIRACVDVAAIDLVEAARREALAATARRRLYDVARALLRELSLLDDNASAVVPPLVDRSAPPVAGKDSLLPPVRHVIVDDAHDLGSGDLDTLREASPQASLFVTGDQRAAAWTDGRNARFRALLHEAGRAVVLLEAPRFGAGVGRFVNALGVRLWPPSEPGGYAPALSRVDFDPSAASPAELWLVRRRPGSGPDGADRPEPIADARQREARAVARGVRRALGAGPRGDIAVLVQDERARPTFAAALEAEGLRPDKVGVRTVDESQGLEWSTVFVTGLDEPMGGPAPRRAWVDKETGLAVVWPMDENGQRIWPFSSLLLAQRAAVARDASARQRLFLSAARARTRVILTGVTRDRAAGGETCIAPIEWLRRQLGIADLAALPARCRIGEADVGVTVVDGEAVAQV
jgi:hypothetical protein